MMKPKDKLKIVNSVKVFIGVSFLVLLSYGIYVYIDHEQGRISEPKLTDASEVTPPENFDYPYDIVSNTEGLNDTEMDIIRVVDNFYQLILNNRFDELGVVISSNLDVTIQEIADYYKATYTSNDLKLSNFKVSTIDLGDGSIKDTLNVRVLLEFTTPDGALSFTDILTLKQEERWVIISVKTLSQ